MRCVGRCGLTPDVRCATPDTCVGQCLAEYITTRTHLTVFHTNSLPVSKLADLHTRRVSFGCIFFAFCLWCTRSRTLACGAARHRTWRLAAARGALHRRQLRAHQPPAQRRAPAVPVPPPLPLQALPRVTNFMLHAHSPPRRLLGYGDRGAKGGTSEGYLLSEGYSYLRDITCLRNGHAMLIKRGHTMLNTSLVFLPVAARRRGRRGRRGGVGLRGGRRVGCGQHGRVRRGGVRLHLHRLGLG